NWTPVTQDVNGQPLAEGTVQYVIFRGSNANFAPDVALTSEPVTTTTYSDTSFQYGQPYYYFVRATNTSHRKAQQSPVSNVLLMYPQDTFAPQPPQELNVVSAREGMVLIWAPNEEEDVAGYNIFRSTEQGKDYVKINKQLVRETTYTDTDIQRRQKYYYVVTAVDNAPVPNESGYSSEISETAKPQ
ncbi:MAG TPA: fibronectin type III domain-containing protein, partial [Acidobacteriota bacterium]|nr:fibronectin type III domain-containing protein [Acidobacteriota bacterium]